MIDYQLISSQLLIAAGCALQVVNAVRFVRFIAGHRHVASPQRALDRRLGYVVAALIAFFIPVYAYLLILSIPNIWVGALLFAGAVFVTIVLEWIFRLTGSIRDDMLSISQTLVGVMEASDPSLNGHSRHVQNLSLLLYDALPTEQRRRVRRSDLSYAALFHDIGKLGISDLILQKPGKLTSTEMDLVRDHPRIGADILSSVDSLRDVAQWVLYHHERIDGQGYYRLPGEKIPFASRIIAVADTFSAVTMRRSYKDPRSYEEGARVLREVAGTQLDAELVRVFCSIPRDKVLACAPDTIEIVGRPAGR